MLKRWMTDILIAGTGVTGLVTAGTLFQTPHAFTALLSVVNLSTAVFLLTFVRPLILGRPIRAKGIANGALLTLLASSGALFWVEYFTITPRLGALTAAVTWTAGAAIYGLDLLLETEEDEAVQEEAPKPERQPVRTH